MNLILLGGANPATKKWVDEVEASVKSGFESTTVQRYLNWETGAEDVDFNYETDRLRRTATERSDVMIFAKSAGALVTLRAIRESVVKPDKCVFVGIPVNYAREKHIPIDGWLEGYATPTLFVQQTEDPAIGFSGLATLLDSRGVTNHTMIEIPGNDHYYDDVPQLGQLITDFATREI